MDNLVRKKLLTTDEFAEALGLKSRTIRQKVWRREIEVVRVGRNVRFRAALVDELIKAGTVPALPALEAR